MMEEPGADSEEKQEPASDIEIERMDRLKALDSKWPIREADIRATRRLVCFGPEAELRHKRDNRPVPTPDVAGTG
jgi:hypothetical protein